MKLFGIKIKDDRMDRLDELTQEHSDLCANATEVIEKVGHKVAILMKEGLRRVTDNR